MIQVGHNPILRLPSSSHLINDLNKPSLISAVTHQYQRHFTKNCLTYQLTYRILKQLTNGIFNQDLISEVFLNLKNNSIFVSLARKYIEDVKEMLGEELEEEGFGGWREEGVVEEESSLSGRGLEVESEYERSIKCLGDELSVCSDKEVFLNENLLTFSSPMTSPKYLQINHPIDISISISISPPDPDPTPTFPTPTLSDIKPSGQSQLSTHSDHSLSKSCMITSKDKQFLIKPHEVKKDKIDYKDQYDRKMNKARMKNAMSMYNPNKKK